MLGGFQPTGSSSEPHIEKSPHDPTGPSRLLISEGLLTDGENGVGGEFLARFACRVEQGDELLAGAGDGIRGVHRAHLRLRSAASQGKIERPRGVPAKAWLGTEEFHTKQSRRAETGANFDADTWIPRNARSCGRRQDRFHRREVGETLGIGRNDIPRFVVGTAGIAQESERSGLADKRAEIGLSGGEDLLGRRSLRQDAERGIWGDSNVIGMRGTRLDARGVAGGSQMQETGGSPGNSQIGIRVFKNLRGVVGLPADEIVQYALADRRGLREPAIEEHKIHHRPCAQEVAQVARHGRILGVRETHFAQAESSFERMLTGCDQRKEALEQECENFSRGNLRAQGSGKQRGSRLGNGHRPDFALPYPTPERVFLDFSAACEQLRKGGGRQLRARGQFFLEKMGQREIEIVAAEQKMVAHGDALNAREVRVGPRLDREEAQIGRAASHIDHKHMGLFVSSRQSLRSGAIIFQPSVKCRLGFLDENRGVGKTRFPRGLQRELLRSGVEGCWNGDGEILGSQ